MTKDDVRRLVDEDAEQIAKDIVAEWRRIATTEVWLSLPPVMTFDDLPNVLRAVAAAALSERFLEEQCRNILHYSALHGRHRQEEGFQEQFLHNEYYLTRRSLWDFLRSRLPEPDAVRAITRADAAITLATQAALRGFHYRTFQDRGDWPAALERLLLDWPLADH
jgi:hypothetical protein